MTHKFSPAEYAARKKARADAAAANNGGNENVKARLDRLEKALGIVPAATK